MKSARERIEFLVRFTALDMTALRPGDWLNLRDDIQTFLGWGPHAVGSTVADLGGLMTSPLVPPLPQDMPEGALRALQTDVKRLLDDLVGGRQAVVHTLEPLSVSARYSVLAHHAVGAPILCAQGATRDMVLLKEIHLLTREDTARVTRCPECGTLFWRVRRQRYCGRTCVTRANKRDWRAGRSTRRKAKPGKRKNVPANVPAGTRKRPTSTSRQPTRQRKTPR